jgi:parallel beta-helix repeat protein
MHRKVVAVWVSLLIMVSSIVVLVEIAERVEAPTTLYVGGGGGGNYSKIQWAIDNASSGDTVFVYNGTYYENVVIDKSINLLGEDMNVTIIDGGLNGDVIKVTNDYVNMSGFSAINSGSSATASGIELNNVQFCNIFNTNISYNRYGIKVYFSHENNISNNYVMSNKYGIHSQGSDGNILSNNIAFNNTDGIYLWGGDYNIITENYISIDNKLFDVGIYLRIGSWNKIENNTISYCNHGIELSLSNNNLIINNTLIETGLYINGDSLDHWNTHNISTSNTANGKPIYYWKNRTDGEIPPGAGQVILANCSNITVKNQELSICTVGVEMGFSSQNQVLLNNVSNNERGINLHYSSENILFGNNASKTAMYGIELKFSHNNTIENNTASYGFLIGINLRDSNTNDVIMNRVFNNDMTGISLSNCARNNINENNASINGGSGIFFYSSTHNNINNNNVFYNDYGIRIRFSQNNSISTNIVSINRKGAILFDTSDMNDIIHNNIIFNGNATILENSFNNTIHHNNFINNTNQSFDDTEYGNYWDSGYPGGGNFWSEYIGIDLYNGPNQNISGSDKIGDTNYSIDIDSFDNYPLMNPIENYTVLLQGWNLVSIPIIQTDQTILKVLDMMNGSYDAIQWYNLSDPIDLWKHYKIGKSFGNDLFVLNETMSFWIHITQPGYTIFLYNGTQPTSNQTIQLHPGWNMVGYPSLSSHNRTTGLNNLTFDTHVDCIQWYDAFTKTWHFMGPDDSFVPGRGYWVHSKVDAKWEVPL